jgi:hypothetical protein
VLSVLTVPKRKIKYYYHKIMYIYCYVLFRDCLDIQLKERYYNKARHHETRMAS